MKKLRSITFVLISTIIIYIGHTYYKNHKEKETYKTAFVKDLEQAYRRISLEELDRAKKMRKNIQQYFDTVRQETNEKKNSYENARNFIVAERHHNINLDLETLDDTNWKVAQQSGVLSIFDKNQLVVLNKVYSKNNKLRNAKKTVKELTLEPFPFSTKLEMNTISNKYLTVLLKLETSLYDLENATRNAIKELDSDNKFIRELNSQK